MPARPRVPLLAALAVSLLSCGAVTPSSDQACADIAQARCDKRSSCTGGAGITRVWGDMTTCLAREKLSCTIGVAAPSSGNSPTAVEKCVAALAGTSCADFLDNNPPADCVIVGLGANGAACAFMGQCASSYCKGVKDAACGTCADAPAAGASCATSACARDEECVESTSLCQPFGGEGAGCDATHPCGADLSCGGATATAMGTCMASSTTVGGACGGTMTGCDGTKGLACVGAAGAKTCAAITFVDAGMPCGPMTDGSYHGCAAAGTCYTATGVAGPTETGTCEAPAADGAACDTALGPACLAPARCVPAAAGTAGTCTVPSGPACG